MTSDRSVPLARIIPFGSIDGFDNKFASGTGVATARKACKIPEANRRISFLMAFGCGAM